MFRMWQRLGMCIQASYEKQERDWQEWQILNDSNISTPIPEIPETPFYGFDCFRVLCRFSRIVSKMQKEVFSISATLLPRSILICIVERLEEELENWKDSITKEYRPGDECLLSGMLDLRSIELKVRISFHYYSAVIALSRLNINIMPSDCSAIARTSEEKLLNASRAIIELTRLIGVESHTPISSVFLLHLSLSILHPLTFETGCSCLSHYQRLSSSLTLLSTTLYTSTRRPTLPCLV